MPLAVDTRTGDQIFKQNDYHGAPTNTTSQILQQSIVGKLEALPPHSRAGGNANAFRGGFRLWGEDNALPRTGTRSKRQT